MDKIFCLNKTIEHVARAMSLLEEFKVSNRDQPAEGYILSADILLKLSLDYLHDAYPLLKDL